MAGTIKRTKSGATPRAPDLAPTEHLEVRRVSPGQMRQALALLGLREEGKALPAGRFARGLPQAVVGQFAFVGRPILAWGPLWGRLF
jgi:hypothetical protein